MSDTATAARNAPANQLGNETSPYLLQHRDNPVHWRAWGDAAFAEARASNKPILLSVGYAACHWCHVMAHESFEDPDTARVMNELFVNIKVDDEEWLVPHFEKMLYDNAPLIELLSLVWQDLRNPLYQARVEETVGWVLREM